jgi:hypothetical protein
MGLSGRRPQGIRGLAEQKMNALGLQDPLERSLLEKKLRDENTLTPVGGAVRGALYGAALAQGGRMLGNAIPRDFSWENFAKNIHP